MSDIIYARRIRIKGKPDDASGYSISLTDVETGKSIDHVAMVVIVLKPTELNEVCLTYWTSDEQGRIITDVDGDVQERKMIVSNPEISLTAYEREDKAEYIRRERKR